MLTISNLKKSYDGKTNIIDDLNLVIETPSKAAVSFLTEFRFLNSHSDTKACSPIFQTAPTFTNL